MARGRRFWTRENLPDEMPRSAISDGLLKLRGRALGRDSGPRLALFAVLGLLFLFGVVGALWAASHFSRQGRAPSLPITPLRARAIGPAVRMTGGI